MFLQCHLKWASIEENVNETILRQIEENTRDENKGETDRITKDFIILLKSIKIYDWKVRQVFILQKYGSNGPFIKSKHGRVRMEI